MGRLVLHSIPTKETEEMLVSYLGRIVKNVSSEKVAQKIKQTPFVLSKNISNKKGLESLQKKSHPSRQQDSPGLGKKVITAIVVICLAAVLSLLGWQLYFLIGK